MSDAFPFIWFSFGGTVDYVYHTFLIGATLL